MVTSRQRKEYFNIMVVTFTAVLPTASKKMPVSSLRKKNGSKKRKSETPAATW